VNRAHKDGLVNGLSASIGQILHSRAI